MASNTVKIYWFNLALTGLSSCLSLVGGFMIIIVYVKLKNIRNYFTRTLLLYLTIADLMTATGNLVATFRYWAVHDASSENENWTQNCSAVAHEVHHNHVCVGQSFVTMFSNLASFFWTAIIAVHIWVSVTFKSRRTEMTCAHVIYHVISWCIPLSIVTPLFVKGYLGEDTCYGTGAWCGIRSGLERDLVRTLMLVSDIGWQFFCYLLASFCYMFIKFKLWLKRRYAGSQEFHRLAENLRNGDKNFIMVVLVIYSLKLWGIIRFFITSYTSEERLATDESLRRGLTFLLFMQSYGASGQAFWNFMLFCVFDKEVRTGMKKFLGCNQKEEMKELTESVRIQTGESSVTNNEKDILMGSNKGIGLKQYSDFRNPSS